MERKKKGNVKLLVMAFAAMSVICTSCSGSPIQTAGNGDSGSSVALSGNKIAEIAVQQAKHLQGSFTYF